MAITPATKSSNQVRLRDKFPFLAGCRLFDVPGAFPPTSLRGVLDRDLDLASSELPLSAYQRRSLLACGRDLCNMVCNANNVKQVCSPGVCPVLLVSIPPVELIRPPCQYLVHLSLFSLPRHHRVEVLME